MSQVPEQLFEVICKLVFGSILVGAFDFDDDERVVFRSTSAKESFFFTLFLSLDDEVRPDRYSKCSDPLFWCNYHVLWAELAADMLKDKINELGGISFVLIGLARSTKHALLLLKILDQFRIFTWDFHLPSLLHEAVNVPIKHVYCLKCEGLWLPLIAVVIKEPLLNELVATDVILVWNIGIQASRWVISNHLVHLLENFASGVRLCKTRALGKDAHIGAQLALSRAEDVSKAPASSLDDLALRVFLRIQVNAFNYKTKQLDIEKVKTRSTYV
jgi:hypothetical protein